MTTAQGLNVLDITNADSLVITEAAAKKLRRCSDNGSKRDSQAPVITEKSSEAMAEDKYTFDVDTRVNKTQVKMAVEEIFNVKVASVNIMNYKPKKKRMGRYQGYTNKRRKAIVTLKEGSIDLFN